jgi:hypothetical protein
VGLGCCLPICSQAGLALGPLQACRHTAAQAWLFSVEGEGRR